MANNAAQSGVVAQNEERLFTLQDQLNRSTSTNLASRHSIKDNSDEWDLCLKRDLQTKLIDEIYPYLWLLSRKAGEHIDPLHKQVVKKRSVVPVEDPKLHLVWYYDTIYVKPLPDYLLNFTFWRDHLPESAPQDLERPPQYNKYRAALGFLRSYSFLIKHESDFIIAQKSNLLPKYVSFYRFQKFICKFRELEDKNVSHRYQYGQLRLDRLNWAALVIKVVHLFLNAPENAVERFPWSYHETRWETTQYIQYYAAPFIFVFAVLSLILSSMQVVLAALGPNAWDAFVRVSWGFPLRQLSSPPLPSPRRLSPSLWCWQPRCSLP